MELIEMAGLQKCIQEVSRSLGFNTHDEVVAKLAKIDGAIDRVAAKKYMDGLPFRRRDLPQFSAAVIKLLQKHYDKVRIFYSNEQSQNSLRFIESIIQPKRYWNVVERNWNTPFEVGFEVMPTGIYQLYRRYKPDSYELDNLRAPDPSKHFVAIELVYIDTSAMQCMLITRRGEVYIGSLTTNFEGLVYGLLQRPHSRHEPVSNNVVQSQSVNRRIHTRFLYLKPSEADISVHSGICLKTGDFSIRPLSAECLLVPVPESAHENLYRCILKEYIRGWSEQKIAEESVIMDYISGVPNSKNETGTFRRVEDFPLLDGMSKPSVGRVGAILREPSRTIRPETLRNMIGDYGNLGVYQKSKFVDANSVAEGC